MHDRLYFIYTSKQSGKVVTRMPTIASQTDRQFGVVVSFASIE